MLIENQNYGSTGWSTLARRTEAFPMNKLHKVQLTAVTVVAAFAIVTIATSAQTKGRGADKAWLVKERTVPVPAAASDALRKVLLNAPAPEVAASRQNSPKSKAAWIKAIAARNADLAKGAEKFAKQVSVSVKREEIEGVPVRHVVPASVALEHRNHLFIHLHGGAYVVGSGDAGVSEAILIASRAKIPVLSIDYRMPPKHHFPAAVNDVVSVYKHLLKERPAKSMAIGGTSAGGGLALASTHKLIELGLAVPAALFAGTPWADLTKTGDSHFTNEGIDRVLVTYDGVLAGAAKLYAGDHDMKNPLISPVYGDFKGFPPTYLVTGTRDLFLSDVARTHRKLRTAGIVADLNAYEGVSHGEYCLIIDSPESQQAYGELGAFLSKHLK